MGIDTTRFHPKTGPVAGSTWLLEGTLGVQPFDDQRYGSVRLDAQQYLPLPLISGGNLALRGSVATSGLGDYARGYWLSSYDTLRAYSWGDPALLGRHYWFANAELQVPLDAVLRTALASSIEGVAGLDFGGRRRRHDRAVGPPGPRRGPGGQLHPRSPGAAAALGQGHRHRGPPCR